MNPIAMAHQRHLTGGFGVIDTYLPTGSIYGTAPYLLGPHGHVSRPVLVLMQNRQAVGLIAGFVWACCRRTAVRWPKRLGRRGRKFPASVSRYVRL